MNVLLVPITPIGDVIWLTRISMLRCAEGASMLDVLEGLLEGLLHGAVRVAETELIGSDLDGEVEPGVWCPAIADDKLRSSNTCSIIGSAR